MWAHQGNEERFVDQTIDINYYNQSSTRTHVTLIGSSNEGLLPVIHSRRRVCLEDLALLREQQ